MCRSAIDVKERKLFINADEAETVRLIFRRYAELGSVALLRAELDRTGVISKRRGGSDGQISGGARFSRGALYLMLQNHLYRGEVAHKDNVYPGQHEAIIELELWRTVQDKLAANRHERSLAAGTEAPSLLSGLIFDSEGDRMTPTHAIKRSKRYRYYVSASLLAGDRQQSQRGMRAPAGDIEGLALDRLRQFFASSTEVGDTLAPLGLDARELDGALRNAFELHQRWLAMPRIEMTSVVRDIVEQVTIAADRIDIRLSRTKIAAAMKVRLQNLPLDFDPIVLSIEAKLRRAGKGKRLVIENGAGAEVNTDLVAIIAEAFAIRNKLLSGPDDSIEAMIERLGISAWAPELARAAFLSCAEYNTRHS